MLRVLILGAGKIGRTIAKFLSETDDYQVVVADAVAEAVERAGHKAPRAEARVADATDVTALRKLMDGFDVVVSALSFDRNPTVAEVALDVGASYLDLTEDVATTRHVRQVAEHARDGQVFIPQCGLAPGFISIAGYHLARQLDEVDRLHMRVGALPQFPTNELKYNLTWSTDGLINEYCNPCDAIVGSKRRDVLPLEGLEHFSLDGVRYEAFNTSGGLGSLCETLDGRVRALDYKTIRYQGHRDLVRFLLTDLRLSERRDLLKEILERAIPVTFQDVVIVFCTASGMRDGQLVQLVDARKIYSQVIGAENWSAIQITTAAGLCTMLDLHAAGKLPPRGFVRQEEVGLGAFIDNRFGRYYDSKISSRFTAAAASVEALAAADAEEQP
jgi:saccharopine dehydrogenase-like NADP-dependent oxidoreductase